MSTRAWILAALATLACAPAGAGTSGAPARARYDHGADRIIVTQMAYITGVTVTQRFTFVASEHAVATFDRLIDSWMPPVSNPEPAPARRILGVAAHPLDNAAWIVEEGGLVRFEPTLGWSVRTMIPGRIDAVVLDRRDPQAGIFVRSIGAWQHVSPSGIAVPIGPEGLPPAADRISPQSLEELMREHPALRGYARLLTRDASMRSWPPSAGAAAPEGGEVWLGTRGYGVFRVDPEFMRSVHEPYGLLAPGAGALALAADGVWIAGASDGSGRRTVGGLTFVSPDLRDWEWWSPTLSMGSSMHDGHDLVVRGRRAWMAARVGAVRLDLGGTGAAQHMTIMHELPSDDVYALAVRLDGVWIGTSRGLVFVPEQWDDPMGAATPRPEGTTLFLGTPVTALVTVGDTLWVGTDDGLFVTDARRGAPARVAAAGTDPRLRRSVIALAHHDSVVAVATPGEIVLVHARTREVLPTPAAATVRATGAPDVVRLDARTLWIGGFSGVLVIDRATGSSRRLDVPRELPGPVRDIALTELFAWVATTEGLVRLRRLPDGSVR